MATAGHWLLTCVSLEILKIQRNILMAEFTEILIETQSHRISAIHLFPRIITRARGYTIYPVMFDQKTYKNKSDVAHSV